MLLSPADVPIYQQRLQEAEAALHRIRIGRGIERIRHGDKDETFSTVNAAELQSYCDELRAALGMPTRRQPAQRVIVG